MIDVYCPACDENITGQVADAVNKFTSGADTDPRFFCCECQVMLIFVFSVSGIVSVYEVE